VDVQDDGHCYSNAEVKCLLFPVEKQGKLRGYQSSQQHDFHGFKVHLLVTAKSQPVELLLSERCFTISKD